MNDEREQFIASSDGRRSNGSEASRWSENAFRRSHLGSGFQLAPFRATHGGYRMVDSSGDLDASRYGRLETISTANSRRPALNGEKSNRGASWLRKDKHPHIFLHWWKELLACILFIGALLAFFATVYAFNNQPSPSWPTWISLNTIISIYAIVMEVGIIFVTAEGIGQLKWSWFAKDNRPLDDLVKYDDATRGPLGALSLLWRLRGRSLLASFGALIGILALGLSPFAQQVVRYYNCATPINETSHLPRTNYYLEDGGLHLGALEEILVADVQKSMLAGIFSPSRSPDVHCSTGNCTWPREYSTVGWCSACEDISDKVVMYNKTYQYNVTYLNTTETHTSWNMTTAVLESDGTYSVVVEQTNPTGYSVLYNDYAAMGQWIPPSDYNPTSGRFVQASRSGWASYFDFIIANKVNGLYPSTDSPINLGTGRPFPRCNDVTRKDTWPCQGYGGSRCALYPCVKTFAANVVAGKLQETLKSTTGNWSSGYSNETSSLTVSMLDLQCLKPNEVGSLVDLGFKISSGQRWLAYNSPFWLTKWQSNDTFPESMMNRDCLYAMNIIFINSIDEYLTRFFNGTVNGGIPRSEEFGAGQFTGSQIVQQFFNWGSADLDWVDKTFDNFTTSLTNYIRQNGVSNFSTPAAGVVNETKTCIDVRWLFLTYPATLAIMTLLFFVLMLLATRPTGLRPRVWKSSPLALLYHGLIGWDESRANSSLIEEMKGMENAAKSTAVKLDNTFDSVTRLEVKNRFDRK